MNARAKRLNRRFVKKLQIQPLEYKIERLNWKIADLQSQTAELITKRSEIKATIKRITKEMN